MSLPAFAGMEPLLKHIEVEADAAGAQCIFNSMLGCWLIAKDRTCAPPRIKPG